MTLKDQLARSAHWKDNKWSWYIGYTKCHATKDRKTGQVLIMVFPPDGDIVSNFFFESCLMNVIYRELGIYT